MPAYLPNCLPFAQLPGTAPLWPALTCGVRPSPCASRGLGPCSAITPKRAGGPEFPVPMPKQQQPNGTPGKKPPSAIDRMAERLHTERTEKAAKA